MHKQSLFQAFISVLFIIGWSGNISNLPYTNWQRVEQPVSITQQSISAFLYPPYPGTASEESIFDHEYPTYETGGRIVAFTGDVATSVNCGIDTCVNPYFNLSYWSSSLGDWLAYDGHDGIDYGIKYRPIFAAADSDQVLHAGWDDPQNHKHDFGLYVQLHHSNGYETLYGHMSAISVEACEPPGCVNLSHSDVIGVSGNTGHSGGPHLHFMVYNPTGKKVDPYGWTGTYTDPNSPNQPESLWVQRPSVIPGTTKTVLPSGNAREYPPAPGDEEGVNVDDGENGFVESPGGCWTVTDGITGAINGNLRYVTPTNGGATCTAQWNFPSSLTARNYAVYVHIPPVHAGSEGAIYKIRHNGQESQAIVAQRYFNDPAYDPDGWVFIGKYRFAADGTEYVSLGNSTEDESGSLSGLSLGVDAVKFVPAATPPAYALTVSKAGGGSGTVTSTPAGINCGSTCSYSFDQNTQVTLAATPNNGATFAGWSGVCSGTGSCVVSMDATKSVTANFTMSYTLTVSKTGSGAVTSNPAGINCGSTCSYSFNQNTQVTLTAVPNSGSTFTGWSGACSGTGSCVVSMDAAKSVTASFTSTYTLTVSKAGSGSGAVTSTPAGINCGSTCSYSFNQNTQVTLTATSNSSSTFTGWSGACSGTGSCVVSMYAARSVTANFTLNTYTLNVSKITTYNYNHPGEVISETGGNVTSAPDGINCGSTCSHSFTATTSVTLTANPASNYYHFTGWSGACSGAGVCTLTMNTNKSVTANFVKATFSGDVPFDYTDSIRGVPYYLHDYIEALWVNHITAGCWTDPPKYCPVTILTRAEAATFLLRVEHGSSYQPPQTSPPWPQQWVFYSDDWSRGLWARPWAERLWVERMTSGCWTSPLKFCPWDQLPRDQASVFALRIKYGTGYPTPIAKGTILADMTDVSYWGTGWAEQAYLNGLLPSCGFDMDVHKPRFCPSDKLSRAWFAYMIVKAKGLSVVNTRAAQPQFVDAVSKTELTFDNLLEAGDTTVNVQEEMPAGEVFSESILPLYYDIETTSTFTGQVLVKLVYDATGFTGNEAELRMYQLIDGQMVDVTLGNPDTVSHSIEGLVDHFCIFAIGIPNRPPVAEAGTDQIVESTSSSGALVTLDGTGSYDPDAGNVGLTPPTITPDGRSIVSYTWTGPFGELSGSQVNVNLPEGIHTITLIVSDGRWTSEDTVQVNVTPMTLHPTVEAGGPYEVNEGNVVTLNASGNDPAGGELTFAWDLDNDGIFETAGQSVTFSAAQLDGPASQTIAVQATNSDGFSATDQATVEVLNIAPTAALSNDGPVSRGSPVTISFSEPSDPSSADTAAGFHYAFACDGSSLDDATYTTSSASATWQCTYSDDPGDHTVRARIMDQDGGYSDNTTIVQVNNVAPVAHDDSKSTDEDVPLTFPAHDLAGNDSDVDGDNLTVSTVTPTPNIHGALSLAGGFITYTPEANFNGTASFAYTINDGNGGTDTAIVTVTVNPINDAPVAHADSKSTDEDIPLIFPATNLTANDTDVDGDSLTVTTVTVAPNTHGVVSLAGGSITYIPEANFNGTASFAYTISDGNGGTDTAIVTVNVNPVNDTPAVGDIIATPALQTTNTIVMVKAPFTDVDRFDTHVAIWNWGDGSTSAGVVTETVSSGSVTGSHIYTVAGVYTLGLMLTDNGGASVQSVLRYVVIYDPNAGFVTGGGWIDSQAGSCAFTPACEGAVGKTTFEFEVKYKNGANTPTGQTQFNFKTGNLSFNSTNIQWLVIAGAKAQYKGSGVVNGGGDYGFLLTVIDGQINGKGGSDKFRIKIWDKATGVVIYDNQMGMPENANPTTLLGGGSIVIHK